MTKTISVAGLGHGGASRAVRDAEQEPVLISKENRPVAWMLSAEKLAEVAAAQGEGTAGAYRHALWLLAVYLYRDNVLTLGHGAKLAGMSLSDFIDLCGRLQVTVLWEYGGGVEREQAAAAAMVDDSPSRS